MGNSLAVQWLGLCAFTAEGPGSTPGQGTKIPQAVGCSQTNKQINKKPKMTECHCLQALSTELGSIMPHTHTHHT